MHFNRLPLVALLLAACTPTEPGASTTTGDPPDVVQDECPAPQGEPIEHDSKIVADETWRADAGPHVIAWETTVDAGVTLTIEPCARVIFREGAALSLRGEGARLVAEGTASRPITFAGENGARWGALTVADPATASLKYVSFADGGGDKFAHYASIDVLGDAKTPPKAPVLFDHVTVEGSQGPGVRLSSAAAFAAGSTALTVKGSGYDEIPYPVVIGEHAIDSMPEGSYTGNLVDELLIDPEGANGSSLLQLDTTMRDRGVPWHFGTFPTDHLALGAGLAQPPQHPTLTIEAGVTLRFTPGAWLDVGSEYDGTPATAALRILGTAERPVVLTSAQAAPKPGDWGGLFYRGVPDPSNLIEHAIIEYTGADCSCSLNTCSDTGFHESALILNDPPATAFIHDTRFAHGAGHGIFRGWKADADLDLTPTNTFEDLAGCAQTMWVDSKGHCPLGQPACP